MRYNKSPSFFLNQITQAFPRARHGNTKWVRKSIQISNDKEQENKEHKEITDRCECR